MGGGGGGGAAATFESHTSIRAARVSSTVNRSESLSELDEPGMRAGEVAAGAMGKLAESDTSVGGAAVAAAAAVAGAAAGAGMVGIAATTSVGLVF